MAEVFHSPDDTVVAYRYLCRRGARKFVRDGVERCDLEQVAAIGLIKAARRFDERNGTPFEAYAWTMIVGELMHYVRDHERPIRIPRRLRALDRRSRVAHESLVARLGREPSDDELSGELGIERTIYDDVRRAHAASALSSLRDAETLAIDGTPSAYVEAKVLVDLGLASLGPSERTIIIGVYVLGLSHVEIGRKLGLSPKRVARARYAALGRMQRALAS